MITSRSDLLRMRNVSDQSVEKINTFMFNIFSENLAIYEIMWKDMVQQGRLQMTV